MSIMDPRAMPAQIRSVAFNRSGDNIEKLEPANFHLERVLFRKTASLRVISLAGYRPYGLKPYESRPGTGTPFGLKNLPWSVIQG
ncbi:MAG: hypothetical protein ABSH17_12325 [Syntrophobacteraceae bacterium]